MILKKKIAVLKGGFFHALKTFCEKTARLKAYDGLFFSENFCPPNRKVA